VNIICFYVSYHFKIPNMLLFLSAKNVSYKRRVFYARIQTKEKGSIYNKKKSRLITYTHKKYISKGESRLKFYVGTQNQRFFTAICACVSLLYFFSIRYRLGTKEHTMKSFYELASDGKVMCH
jgi:hypothetical protein